MKRKYYTKKELYFQKQSFKTSMLQIKNFRNILRRTSSRLTFKGACVSNKGLSQSISSKNWVEKILATRQQVT